MEQNNSTKLSGYLFNTGQPLKRTGVKICANAFKRMGGWRFV